MAAALESLLHGLISLGIALVLAGFILATATQHGRHGNPQLAADSLHMLWSPAVFAGVGALLIANGLVRSLWLMRPRSSRVRPRVVVPPRDAPPAPARAAPAPAEAPAPPDAYSRACAELGVEPGSPWPVVRATWRRNLSRWHPDQGGSPELWSRKLAAYTLLEAWQQFEHPGGP
ncbi:hypothetical protein KBY71_06520 [Cyanobium sp. T1B-Tous]|uniref:hypothetical protein n=1 Tax=Cyanobium sp. T1B-Tous TaxID=2823721 RepID=UPI0020CCE734|nr:hypothetical protein [Cyanobium sp. T1B-Tous]MCP9806170.1 hypothetical protein [Cyanobium sp. T1B-Tous]